jgi:hypothetical protein
MERSALVMILSRAAGLECSTVHLSVEISLCDKAVHIYMLELVVHGRCLRNPLTYIDAARRLSGCSANISYFVQTVVVPKTTLRRMIGRLENNGLERMWKEGFMA